MNGLNNGMVMQRNENNVCDVFVTSETELKSVTYSGKLSGTAELKKCGENRYNIIGIPVGGPYTIHIDGENYFNVYVGDLWILAGQSNMQGLGWLTEEDYTEKGDNEVRALYMQDYWDNAKEPLHLMWMARDKVHTSLITWDVPAEVKNAFGPGTTFAKKMKELTGVPQGVLCCAHGGTSLILHWDEQLKVKGPDKSLYAAMLRRFNDNGGRARGMFWWQGCSDASANRSDVFTDKMISFMDEFHKDFGNIPTVQVQIGHFAHSEVEWVSSEGWMKIREQQRLLPKSIDNLYTLASMNTSFADPIHISRDSQINIGTNAARLMYSAVFGESKECKPPIEIENIEYEINSKSGKAEIIVSYKNLSGGLVSKGRPTGFYLTHTPYKPESEYVYDIKLSKNKAIICTWLDSNEMKNINLYYGFGLNPYCNITDEQGRSVPAFGPFKF